LAGRNDYYAFTVHRVPLGPHQDQNPRHLGGGGGKVIMMES